MSDESALPTQTVDRGDGEVRQPVPTAPAAAVDEAHGPNTVTFTAAPFSPPDTVGFDDLVNAFYGYGPDSNEFRTVKDRFEKQNGQIRLENYGDRRHWAVILAPKYGELPTAPELYYRQPAGELRAEFAKILFLADKVKNEVSRRLHGKRLLLALERMGALLTYLFRVVDSDSSKSQTEKAKALEEEFSIVTTELQGLLEEAIQTQTRTSALRYLTAMIYAGVVIGALVLLVVRLTIGNIQIPVDPVYFVTSLIAGLLGAIFSVVLRMTRGDLVASLRELTLGEVLVTGTLRPAIGVISGGLIFVILNSGLVPLQQQNKSQAWYFFAVVAFLAGFSERLIQVVIGRAEQQVGGQQK